MSNFSFLNQFRVQNESQKNDLENIFYPLSENDIQKAENDFGYSLPIELKDFYLKIGYGFFYQKNNDVNRFMDTTSLVQINLKQDEFGADPDLELYDDIYNDDKLLFFEVNEGVYLAIDKEDIEGNNAIYHFKTKIADSLENFILRLLEDPNLIDEQD